MIIKPKIRGFVCVTAHPKGCAAHVQEQIDYVKSQSPIQNGPKKVLVVGASTGYGLASRISAAFGSNAGTIGVFFERPSNNGRPASAGWYNSVAFDKAAKDAGFFSKSINGDAFSNEIKAETIAAIKEHFGKVDLVIYSLASPRRTDPKTGDVYKSVLKPVGAPFSAKSVDTDKKVVNEVSLEPATDEDIHNTVKTMGGEDWDLWIEALKEADVLEENASTIAYSYIGPEVTYPIYRNGTIGKAKEHCEAQAASIREKHGVPAYVSVNKAVVSQASSAIPVVPLYIAILQKVMKGMDLHEGCIEQIHRLFIEKYYIDGAPIVDEVGRLRVDDWEMKPEVQEAVKAIWPNITTDTLYSDSDFAGYEEEFLKLFGFGIEGVDYEEDVEIELELA